MQIFHRSSNALARASLFGAIFIVAALGWVLMELQRSPYITNAGIHKAQPVLFSHQHHVTGLGIDCRYCHTSVETSSFAGLPPTHTCMTCHSQIWSTSPMLEPVRTSLAMKQPIVWTRIHNLPDFVYFNHAIHIQKGIGCVSCHGRVDKMPIMWKEEPLTMEWCLECHRHPERHLREKREVFNMEWAPPVPEQLEIGRDLIEREHIEVDRLTNCSVCHR
jgi:cytochrome c7-like protein